MLAAAAGLLSPRCSLASGAGAAGRRHRRARSRQRRRGQGAVPAKRQMVVAANPIAAQAGLEVLRAGGSAADALVAVQTVLGLVEPQSSGLGGGAFLVWYDAASRHGDHLRRPRDRAGSGDAANFHGAGRQADGLLRRGDRRPFGRRARRSAPARDRASPIWQAAMGRRCSSRAIKLAEAGFDVSPRMNIVDRRGSRPARRAAFGPRLFLRCGRRAAGGRARCSSTRLCGDAEGDRRWRRRCVLQRPDRRRHRRGGQRPSDQSRAASASPTSPPIRSRSGRRSARLIAAAGLRHGTALLRRAADRPDSRDGRAVRHRTLGPDDPESWRIIGDATRLAFADRERYIADSDFVKIPKGLLDPAYLKARRQLIRRPTALGKDEVKAGEPPWDKAELRRDGRHWKCRRPRISSSSTRPATSPR